MSNEKTFEKFWFYLHSTENEQEWQRIDTELREIVLSGQTGDRWLDSSAYIEKSCAEWVQFALYKYHKWSNS